MTLRIKYPKRRAFTITCDGSAERLIAIFERQGATVTLA